MIVNIINGNLLDSNHKYICQQCNCVTFTSKGLALNIARKWKWGDIYSIRKKNGSDIPGTIKVIGDENKNVICMFAQYCPGKPGYYEKYYDRKYSDNYENRKRYFEECLNKIEGMNIKEIAMPYKIGCGLAGGKWKDYKQILEKSKLNITLYKL